MRCTCLPFNLKQSINKTSVVQMVNRVRCGDSRYETQLEDTSSNGTNTNGECEDVTVITEMIEDKENTYFFDSLISMFPNIH